MRGKSKQYKGFVFYNKHPVVVARGRGKGPQYCGKTGLNEESVTTGWNVKQTLKGLSSNYGQKKLVST